MTGPTPLAIAAESPATVAAGREVAARGGNAVDIAVGAALAATVTEPLMCSLGGSAFINLKLPGMAPELIDGADAMPRVPDTVLQGDGHSYSQAQIPYGDGIAVNVGHASVAVPGMLRALELAWQRHGSLPWPVLMEPAVAVARSGTRVGYTLGAWLGMAGEAIFYAQRESRDTFFPNGTTPLRAGDFYTPPHLDQTLACIAAEGADALYRGELGRRFAEEICGGGGYVSRSDLADYRARLRRPIQLRSHGYHLALNPPPSIGGAMVGSMVNLYDALWRPGLDTAERALLTARIQRAMFDLRHREANADWSADRAGQILQRDWLLKFFHKTFAPNTMHLSVATGDGSVVAITMSNGYGSGISIPGTGIPTNNSLGEPELNPAGYYRIAPGGRLVSNMSPTIVWDDSGMALAMGSPGASRITTTILQGWIRLGFEGMGFEDMVRAPRLHVEKIDGEFVLQHEPGIDTRLAANEFNLRAFDGPDMYFGALNVAGIDPAGRLHALADQRRRGAEFVAS